MITLFACLIAMNSGMLVFFIPIFLDLELGLNIGQIGFITAVFTVETDAAGYAKAITAILKNVMENDPDFLNLFYEGFAAARQSEPVRKELSSLYGRFRKALTQCLEDAVADGRIQSKLPVKALASVITAIIDGMGLQLLTEPELIKERVIWSGMEQSILDLFSMDR